MQTTKLSAAKHTDLQPQGLHLIFQGALAIGEPLLRCEPSRLVFAQNAQIWQPESGRRKIAATTHSHHSFPNGAARRHLHLRDTIEFTTIILLLEHL